MTTTDFSTATYDRSTRCVVVPNGLGGFRPVNGSLVSEHLRGLGFDVKGGCNYPKLAKHLSGIVTVNVDDSAVAVLAHRNGGFTACAWPYGKVEGPKAETPEAAIDAFMAEPRVATA